MRHIDDAILVPRDLLRSLLRYGRLKPVEDVRYGALSHREVLDELERLLGAPRSMSREATLPAPGQARFTGALRYFLDLDY